MRQVKPVGWQLHCIAEQHTADPGLKCNFEKWHLVCGLLDQDGIRSCNGPRMSEWQQSRSSTSYTSVCAQLCRHTTPDQTTVMGLCVLSPFQQWSASGRPWQWTGTSKAGAAAKRYGVHVCEAAHGCLMHSLQRLFSKQCIPQVPAAGQQRS